MRENEDWKKYINLFLSHIQKITQPKNLVPRSKVVLSNNTDWQTQKWKFRKTKKCVFFLMSQGSLDPKIRFLGQRMCSVARVQTETHTYTKVNTEETLSGLQEFFLQPIINDRSNKIQFTMVWIKSNKIHNRYSFPFF